MEEHSEKRKYSRSNCSSTFKPLPSCKLLFLWCGKCRVWHKPEVKAILLARERKLKPNAINGTRFPLSHEHISMNSYKRFSIYPKNNILYKNVLSFGIGLCTCKGRVAYIKISLNPNITGITLGIVVIIYIMCILPSTSFSTRIRISAGSLSKISAIISAKVYFATGEQILPTHVVTCVNNLVILSERVSQIIFLTLISS